MRIKWLINATILVILLNGCAQIPLIGSLGSSSITAVATGNYQRSLLTGSIDFAVYESTGKTPSQHLYKAVSNKYTKKKLEKHFPDKKIEFKLPEVKTFGLSWHTMAHENITKINYTVLDKYAPNFKMKLENPPTPFLQKEGSTNKNSNYYLVAENIKQS